MNETKTVLICDDHQFFFENPLEILTEKDGHNITLKIPELDICTDNIYKVSILFKEKYLDISNKDNYSEKELSYKRFFDNLSVTHEKKQKKKKKKINSRAKGKRGENLAIEALRDHFGELKIHKTPGSGSLATIHGMVVTEGIDLSGDIFAQPDDSPEYRRFEKFNYEIKNYATLPDILGEITYKKSGDLKEWISQAGRDCERTGKNFCLIIKSNYSPFFCIFKDEYVKDKDFVQKYLLRFVYEEDEYFIYYLKDVKFL